MIWHLYQQMSLTQTVQYQGYIPQLVRKCIPTPTGLPRMNDRNAVKKYQVKKAHFVPLCKCAQKCLKSVFHFAVNNNRISLSMVCVFFFMPNNLDLLAKNKCWMNQKAHITQCPVPISHSAPFCKTKFTLLLQCGALWVICLTHCGKCEMDRLIHKFAF